MVGIGFALLAVILLFWPSITTTPGRTSGWDCDGGVLYSLTRNDAQLSYTNPDAFPNSLLVDKFLAEHECRHYALLRLWIIGPVLGVGVVCIATASLRDRRRRRLPQA